MRKKSPLQPRAHSPAGELQPCRPQRVAGVTHFLSATVPHWPAPQPDANDGRAGSTRFYLLPDTLCMDGNSAERKLAPRVRREREPKRQNRHYRYKAFKSPQVVDSVGTACPINGLYNTVAGRRRQFYTLRRKMERRSRLIGNGVRSGGALSAGRAGLRVIAVEICHPPPWVQITAVLNRTGLSHRPPICIDLPA